MNWGLRIGAAIWFLLCGGSLAMFLGMAAPGQIYFSSAVLLVGAAFIWLWLPSLAGCVCLPLVAGLTYMLYRYPFGSFRILYGVAFMICYVLIGVGFRTSTKSAWLVAVSVVLTGMWFVANARWSQVIHVHTYEMTWGIDGQAPWGGMVGYDDKPLSLTYNGEALVIVWRPVADGYCWSGVYSNELHDRLRRSGKNLTPVEYNSISDFGNWAGDTIKSIDGVPFYEGTKPLRTDTNALGGHHSTTKEPTLGLCNN